MSVLGIEEVDGLSKRLKAIERYLDVLLLLSLIGCALGGAALAVLCWLGFGG